jgi:hypothetical protein
MTVGAGSIVTQFQAEYRSVAEYQRLAVSPWRAI